MKKRVLLPLALVLTLGLALSLTGCDKKEEVAAPQAPPEITVRPFESASFGISFSYPVGWSISENGRVLGITSVAGLDCAGAIVDLTDEVELFLAGHGDLVDSVGALMRKHVDSFIGEDLLNTYIPNVGLAANGEVKGTAEFYFAGDASYVGVMRVWQEGGRVLLDIFARPEKAEKGEELDALYDMIAQSIKLTGTEGTLAPASLSALGFPDAPYGTFNYYNPISGQFLLIPEEFSVLSDPYDNKVVLFSQDHGMLITQNWTEQFSEIYTANGDLTECYAAFLNDCLTEVETLFDARLIYRDIKYQAGGDNGELVRATFNIDPQGTEIRCFAELAVRGANEDYVQGTFLVYMPGNVDAARNLFNAVMEYSTIEYVLP